jgi:hypothetical protein
MEFLDTGLVYMSGNFVVPLNSNVLKCFFKLIQNAENNALEQEFLKEIIDLKSDIPRKFGYAFE